MKFTDAQQAAITFGIDRNLQLIACAGSGKTEIVARRVAHLLAPAGGGLSPRNVIAFTFTDKAAAELKDRIVRRVREALGDVPGLAEMFVGTIHAYALELLKSEVPKYLRFDVLNEVQQRLFIDRHSKQGGLTACNDLKGEPLKRYRDTDRYVAALNILREAELDRNALVDCSLVTGLESYSALLDKTSHLDYAAILEAASAMLERNEELRSRVGSRIRYVIVDEYQDVNPVQERIVKALVGLGASVCIVGDDDQTIYQWRGSEVHNILSFGRRYSGVHQVTLQDNYRSSEGIVRTARAFIRQNVDRLEKSMEPTGAQVYEPGDIVALPFTSADAEAEYIASAIRQLHGTAIREEYHERGISWSDIAILFRSVKGSAAPVARALDAASIPYVVVGMTDLLKTREAEAARHFFYFMATRPGVSVESVETAWRHADLGLEPRQLRQAIDEAARTRVALSKEDEQRFNLYSIQRVFLKFLEDTGIREESVPGRRGEIVFYNLGKFSQLISDFETIHYHSKPSSKYASFADFLQYRAEQYYPEGWQDNQHVQPDAVQIMTIHQAKGMQWPVVFLPALLKNRFPAKKPGGRSVWHLLPRVGIVGQPRYEGTIEDERRLFYVAMTRSQKFLHFSWAPVPGNQLYKDGSEFFDDVLASHFVKRRTPDYGDRKLLPATPRVGVANVLFSFSDIKYFFECPYQFKLRILYGFNAPIHEALGYGKSLHDALAEVHARAIRGDIVGDREVRALVERHLHTPYAYPDLRRTLEASAEGVIRGYIEANRALFSKIEFAEKQIEINLGDGVAVNGRIDLVRRIDTGETTIVDLKSSDRAQAEDVTEIQLHIYALGYQELTGRRPDYVEIYELDQGKRKPRSVDDDFLNDVKKEVRRAADSLRGSDLRAEPAAQKCQKCDYRGICTAAQA